MAFSNMEFEDWWEFSHAPYTKGLDSELIDIIKRFSKVAWEDSKPTWAPIETAPEEDGVKVTLGWWEDGEWYETVDERFEGVWYYYEEYLQHYELVGKPLGSVGPKEEVPYQYWRPYIEIPKEGE